MKENRNTEYHAIKLTKSTREAAIRMARERVKLPPPPSVLTEKGRIEMTIRAREAALERKGGWFTPSDRQGSQVH